jgi:chromate transporter
MNEDQTPQFPTFGEAVKYWLQLGLISFGGPAGQIAIMHKELVEKKRWISESHFLHALNACMLLPGPEAQQLATYLGWRLHGWKGGLAAGGLFVIPSMFILYGLSWLFVSGQNVPWLAAMFYGLLAAVMAVVASALLRIGRKALRTPGLWVVAALSFIAIFVFKISFVFIILASALVGLTGHQWRPNLFPAGKSHGSGDEEEGGPYLELSPCPQPSWGRALKILAICSILWWAPIFGVGTLLGWTSTPYSEGVFFSKAALVTFGGAYAVLPYVAQQAVEKYGWLTHSQMMSGLGLAETTPGPLIMVLQFVGFMGGWQNPGSLPAWQAATMGALITTWATFVPCFLMVFLGAPHIEHLRASPRLGAALTSITSAVVGVILNLTIWFSWHALWPQGWRASSLLGGMDLFIALVAAVAFVAMERFKVGLITTIIICAILGLAWRWVGLRNGLA